MYVLAICHESDLLILSTEGGDHSVQNLYKVPETMPRQGVAKKNGRTELFADGWDSRKSQFIVIPRGFLLDLLKLLSKRDYAKTVTKAHSV